MIYICVEYDETNEKVYFKDMQVHFVTTSKEKSIEKFNYIKHNMPVFTLELQEWYDIYHYNVIDTYVDINKEL